MNAPARILFIQLRRLGDVVISTPLLRDLHSAWPDAQLDFLVAPSAAHILENNPFVHQVVPFYADRMFQMLRLIRRNRYDLIIDVQAHPRTAILALLSGVRTRVGWDARFWGFVYTHRAPRVTTAMYSGQNRQRLLQLLGITPGSPLPQIFLSDAERENGRAALANAGISVGTGKPIVAIALAAADPDRNWHIDGFAEVVAELADHDVQVAIFTFPGDTTAIADFRSLTERGVLIPWQDDRTFLAELALCDLLISPNTGPSHMATALGVPRITICDSLSAPVWCPAIPGVTPLSNPRQPCMGCKRGRCPVQLSCIRGVLPSEVVTAALHTVRGS